MMKLRADSMWEMIVLIQLRVFSLSCTITKTEILKMHKTLILPTVSYRHER